MAAQVLYRKWRPQTFEQVVGQKHVIQTLRNAVAADEVAHAYLFAGPRGTGKTTTARLLAKAVNCLGTDREKPCNQCAICQAINNEQLLDLIEIDAASNRGIDEIRDLRSKVNFLPSQARYKVYILDEAHMLTDPASKALLKTLEEPPSHVIFILVTTEPHKLPATITSRCQRFDFHRLSLPDIIGELKRIVELEGASPSGGSGEDTQAEALELIARSATGSLRDAISLLDMVMTAGGHKVTLEQVQEALGVARMGAVADLVSSLIEGNVGSGLRVINQVIDEGADPRQFAAQVVEHLRRLMLLQVGGLVPPVSSELIDRMQKQAAHLSTRQVLQALRIFNQAGQEMRRTTQPRLPLEMALVEVILNAGEEQTGTAYLSPAQPVAKRIPTTAKAIQETKAKTPQVEGTPSAPPEPPPAEEETGLAQVKAAWPRILQTVHSRSVRAEALLNACQPTGMEEASIILSFRYPFHRDKAEEEANRALIEEAVSSVLGGAHPIRCVLGTTQPAITPPSHSKEKRQPQGQAGPAEVVQEERAPAKSGEEVSPEEKLTAATDDPVVQAMMERYGARVVDVQ